MNEWAGSRISVFLSMSLENLATEVIWFLVILLVVIALISGKKGNLTVRAWLLGTSGVFIVAALFVIVEICAMSNRWVQLPGNGAEFSHVRVFRDGLLTLWGYWIIAWTYMERFGPRSTDENSLQRFVLRSGKYFLLLGFALLTIRVIFRTISGPTASGGNWIGVFIVHCNNLLEKEVPNTLLLAGVLCMIWALVSWYVNRKGLSKIYSRFAYTFLLGGILNLSLGATVLDYGLISSGMWLNIHVLRHIRDFL